MSQWLSMIVMPVGLALAGNWPEPTPVNLLPVVALRPAPPIAIIPLARSRLGACRSRQFVVGQAPRYDTMICVPQQ